MAGTSSIKKLVDFIWGEQEDPQDDYEENAYNTDYADDYEAEEENNNDQTESVGFFKKRKNIVQMPQPQQLTMKIAKPTNFDQSDEIIMQLKAKNVIVINLEYVSKDIGRRIIDAICGAAKALDGNVEKVTNSIFVAAPYNYNIINEITKEKIESKFSNPWR